MFFEATKNLSKVHNNCIGRQHLCSGKYILIPKFESLRQERITKQKILLLPTTIWMIQECLMDDRELWQLIVNAHQQVPASLEWRVSMNKLLARVQRLPGIKKVSHPDYLDALNKTWEWVWHNIGSFEPRPPSVEKSLVNWINGYLYWRIQDLYIKSHPNTVSLDELLTDDEEDLSLLDQLSQTRWSSVSCGWVDSHAQRVEKQNLQQIWLELEEAVGTDLQGKLKSLCPQGRNDCNCKLLSQKLLLKEPPDSLALLARELKINSKTLLSHWKKKCKPCLQKMVIELNYQLH